MLTHFLQEEPHSLLRPIPDVKKIIIVKIVGTTKHKSTNFGNTRSYIFRMAGGITTDPKDDCE